MTGGNYVEIRRTMSKCALRLSLTGMIVLATAIGAGPELARAGSTDPVLGVGAAVATAAGASAVLEVSGVWAFDDILQVVFPLNVVVSQGSTFARFPVGAAAESGTLAELTDGLAISEITLLEGSGAVDPDASLVRIEHHSMVLALPPIFTDGSLRVVLYVDLPFEDTFISNEVTASLSGITGGAP